jgi:CHAT domain-containing protein
VAAQTGVKSAIASLWYVSDVGTLGLMTEFYQRLKTAPIRAEALRQAQLALLRGQTSLQAGKLVWSDGRIPLSEELTQLSDLSLQHPYYWSGFTMIGSPW